VRTLYDLLAAAAADDPAAPAILALDRAPLTFGGLIAQIDATRSWLNHRGLGPHDRIAVVARRGPDTAVVALAAMCSAACVPLNPSSTQAECERAFSRIRVRTLLVPTGDDSPAREAARRMGLDVVEWSHDEGSLAGSIRLEGLPPRPLATTPLAGPDGIALIVLTSGTTSEPKIVPASHGNLIARAGKGGRLFGHGRQDRCLNLMPLCYAHGLGSGLIAPLACGGSVICPSVFDEQTFFACVRTLQPTWFTAAASYHQAILAWLRTQPGAIAGHTLRFARSASAPLPRPVQTELEELLGIPIVEGYGSSESNVITSNPPDGVRKPGTVGRSPDGDVAVLDDHDHPLPPDTPGEVAVRGATVVAGYEDDPDTTRAAFRDGWYRTGDRGVIDADGYVTLLGRIKEMINRGGEKISPREVDAALVAHPAVAEGVAFPIPHPTLQEDVAAAVVLRPDASVTEAGLRRFLLQRLSPFKVPRRIVFANELPKGPTGKPLRQELAQRFDLGIRAAAGARGDDHLRTPMERTILTLFREVLDRDDLGPDDDFFLSGGDSLAAVDLILRLNDELQLNVPLLALMETPTARQLAPRLEWDPPGDTKDVLGVNVGGPERPVFGLCGRFGHAIRMLLVGRAIGCDQPVYGLQPPDMDWERTGCLTIEDMAAHYVRRMRAIQPSGPYRLLGSSFGGLMVFEMALQLQAAGDLVEFLGLIDTYPPAFRWDTPQSFSTLSTDEGSDDGASEIEAAGIRVADSHVRARARHVIQRRFDGELTYFYCAAHAVSPGCDPRRRWLSAATRPVRLIQMPGLHGMFHQEPQFSPFVDALRACLSHAPVTCESPVEVFGRYQLLRDGSGADVIRSCTGRTFEISTGSDPGRLQSMTFDTELRSVSLHGWAMDPRQRQPSSLLLVFADGAYVGRGAAGVQRDDVADRDRFSGFSMTMRLGSLFAEPPRVRVFTASASGVAVELT